jgi:3',5'-cyclic AMP phosphodiesterase CpdA
LVTPDGTAAGGIHLTFGADPATEMVVSWSTAGPVEAPRVVAIPDVAGGEPAGGRVDRGAATRVFVDGRDRTETIVHHAPLSGLRPDTPYTYEILSGVPARPAGRGTFRTAPAGRAPFTFTSVGDHGTPYPEDRCGSPYAAHTTAGIESLRPLLHLVNGDLSYANMVDDRARTWRNWFSSIEASASRRPWMPAAGNHEIELGNGPLGYAGYQARFALPDNGEDATSRGLWYSFTVGGVRFVALNGDDVCYQPSEPYLRGYSGGRQTAWLERTLKQARADPDTDWIVVFTHQAFVSSAARQNGSDLGLREEWGPLFDAYEVDLVLCGHDHHYERSHPLRGYDEGSPTRTPLPAAVDLDVIDTTVGTVHLLIGFGGAENPSNEHLFDPPAGRTIVGVRPRNTDDAQWGSSGLWSVSLSEPAPWSAVRGTAHPYGFAAFDVDPGEPGGKTTITVTVYDTTGAAPVPFDRFTLTRSRADA